MRGKHKGFTVIQIVTAMVIFCILTGAAFYGASVYNKQAKYEKADADLIAYQTTIETAINYNKPKIMKQTFTPETLNKYIGAEDKITAVQDGETKIFQTEALDPWGMPYRVSVTYSGTAGSLKMEVKVECAGADSVFGTGDESNVVVGYPA